MVARSGAASFSSSSVMFYKDNDGLGGLNPVWVQSPLSFLQDIEIAFRLLQISLGLREIAELFSIPSF